MQVSPRDGKQLVGVGCSPKMLLGVCTLQLRFVDLVLQADFVLLSHSCVIVVHRKVLTLRNALNDLSHVAFVAGMTSIKEPGDVLVALKRFGLVIGAS